MRNLEEFRREQELSNQFLSKLNQLKTKSRSLKKRTSKNELVHLWTRSHNQLRNQQNNLEIELEGIYSNLENDPELAFLQGKTGTPLQDEVRARTNNRIALDEKLYQQIRRLRSVNDELKRGVRRKEEEYLGLVDEVFGFFEETHQNGNLDIQSFKMENKDLDKLTNFYRKNDTVRGFDLTDDLELELDLDYGDLEYFVGEEEDTLIADYKLKIEKLAEETQTELDSIKKNDVSDEILIIYQLNDPLTDVSQQFKDSFSHFNQCCREHKKEKSFLYRVLHKIWPDVTKEMVEVYTAYIEHQKYQKLRKKAVLRCYVRRQKELKQKTGYEIITNLQRRVDELVKAQEQSEMRLKMDKLKMKLMIQKQKYDKIKIQLEKKQRLEEERKKKELELKQIKFENHARLIKSQARKYKKAREAEKQLQVKSAQKAKVQKREKLHQEIQKNLPRVHDRQWKANVKVVEKFDTKMRKKYQKEAENERIKEIISNYSFRPKVKPSFKRMVSDTRSYIHRKETKVVKPGFRNTNTGYEDNRLMKNPKFRLQTRLFEAGLHTTDYAKHLMNNM